MLTVFGENQRTTPVLFFKGKGHVSADGRQQYLKGVHVILSPKAVINVPSMNIFITKWWKMIHDDHPKLFITDSANSHLKPERIQKLRK
ncbi:unnamed protein product [Adineta steineri]|nr:unnamed protein product [Adineta steineri]